MGKHAWRMVLLIAIGVAMLKCGTWAAFRPEDAIIAPREDPLKLLSTLSQAFALLVGVLASRTIDARRLLGVVPLGAAALVMSFSALAFLYIPSTGIVVLHGAALAALLMGWGVVACSVAPRISSLGVTMGFLIYSLIASSVGMMESGVPETIVSAIAMVAPLFSGLLLIVLVTKGAKTLDAGAFRPWAGTALEQFRLVPLQPAIALALCAITTSLSGVFSMEWMELVVGGGILLMLPTVYLMLLILLLVWFLVLKHDSPLNLWPILILIVFVGLISFSSLGGYGISLAQGFATATAHCTRIFIWYFVCSFVFSKGLSAAPFFGVAYLFVSFGPKLTSTALDPLLMALDPELVSLLGTASVAFMAVALVAMAFALLMGQIRQANARAAEGETELQNTEVKDEAGSGKAEGAADAFPALDSLVGRFGLSSREAEVLQLVLRGYTWPMVADELYISLNTAQSHQRNIYRKLGVHKKRELIELCR